MNNKTLHLSDDQLAAIALGQAPVEVTVHLALCEACRAEAGVYRSLLQSTRQVFCDRPVPVNLLACEQPLSEADSRCELDDYARRLHISLTRIDGLLLGQVTAGEDKCDCWQDAAVRLFDGEGLVSSSAVSAGGDFRLAVPDSSRRYSLGLVLPRQGVPELQIIGQFD